MNNLNNKQIYLIFILCGFLLYGNTLQHEYTLDDAIVITDNNYTKKGFSGIWDQLKNDQFVGFYGEKKSLVSGGRYRPLSMVMFNIEYALFGENPTAGHLMNVLWYILNGILLFLTLQKVLPEKHNQKLWPSLAFTAAVLWFFHPIHTEVVANIKGRDEIMAFCGELLVLLFLFKYLDKRKAVHLIWIASIYFLALLSKENAITWIAIYPIAIYFFKPEQIKKVIPAFGVLISTAVIWLFIRYQVVGEGISDVADSLMNDPFLESSSSEKYATIVYTLGKYIQLLFFPHPLTYDYYPKHIPIVQWGNPYVLLSIVAYIALILISIKGFFKRQLPAFGILIFLITLSIASNLIFPIGAFMNERFIYVSSLGFCIIIAYLMVVVLPSRSKNLVKSKKLFQVIGITLLLLYAGKTISRNSVWKDNLTLATHDANISVNGAKSNVMAGGLLTEEAAKTQQPQRKRELLEKAIMHLDRAVKIYPEYVDALLLMGNAQWDYTKHEKNALPYYQRILNINPYHTNTWGNIFIVLEQSTDLEYKLKAYEQLLKYHQNEAKIYLNLGRAYGKEKNDLSMAAKTFETGRKIAPNNYDLLSNLGTVYGLLKNYSAAVEVLEKAISLRPNIAKTHIDLGLSYFYLGNNEKAKQAFDKAVQLDPNLDRNQLPI